jgi:hypothetical protein
MPLARLLGTLGRTPDLLPAGLVGPVRLVFARPGERRRRRPGRLLVRRAARRMFEAREPRRRREPLHAATCER